MKRIILTAMLALAAACSAARDKNVTLADPFILLHDDVYYAYGTSSLSDEGFVAFVSDDLEHWRLAEGKAGDGLVMRGSDAWGTGKFWAPEVYHVDGRFYLYYSAETRVCVAVADSPLGPFVLQDKKPMMDGEKTIDNTLFIDDDGRKYMYYDRFNDGLNVCVAEVGDDCMTVRPETAVKCINVSQEWEKVQGRVNEGSFVIRRGDTYYMTYSANDYRSQNYGIGCATASSPTGPWTKYDHNPLLQNPPGLVGVGHSAMFRDRKGKLKIVFHAHCDNEKIHPRKMFISNVTFTGKGEMRISPDYITPVVVE